MPTPAPDSPPPDPAAPSAPAESAPRPLRRRRRLLVLMGLVITLLIGAIGAAPYVASTHAGSQYLVSFINGRIAGRLGLDSLSLSWGGANELRGLRLVDTSDREVLRIDRLSCSRRLWSLATAVETFEQLTIDGAQATLYLNEANVPSILAALQSRSPTMATGAAALPAPRGKVFVRGGRLRVVGPAGQSYDVADVNGDATLNTLGSIVAQFAIKTSEGRDVIAAADLRDLLAGTEFSLAAATGKAQLQSIGPINVGPLADIFAPTAKLDGAVQFNIQGTLHPGKLDANVIANIARLRTPQAAAPIDLAIESHVTRDGDKYAAHTTLTGDAGSTESDVTYSASAARSAVTLEQILSAALTGEAIMLPEFTAAVAGSIDLVRLQRAVPALLRARADQQITGGTLTIKDVSIRGGAQPSASGSVEIRELTATDAGKAVRLEPLLLAFDAALVAAKGLQIGRAELKSSFAEIVAKGAASEIEATFKGDLAKLRQELGQVVDFGAIELAGNIAGTLKAARASDERINVMLDATGDGVRYIAGPRRLELQRVVARESGFLTLADHRVRRFDFSQADADFDGQAVTSAAGWYDFADGAMRATIDVKRAELAYAAGRAASLGIESLRRYGGSLTSQATLECAGRGQPLVTSGSLTTRDFAVDGATVLENVARFQWTAAKIAADSSGLSLDAARLEHGVATLDIKGVQFRNGATPDVSASVTGSADLAGLLRVAAAAGRSTARPVMTGRVSIDGRVGSAGGIVTCSGRGAIDQFEYVTPSRPISEKRLELDWDAKLDAPHETVTLAKCVLRGSPASAEFAGTIDHYGTTCNVALRGRYDTSWELVTALLRDLAPGAAGAVVMSGKTASPFELTGPLRQPGAPPAFRGLRGGVEISWDQATVAGVTLSAATLKPVLADGRITLPNTMLAAMDGRVNLGGVIEFGAGDPTLKIASLARIVDNVVITPEVGRDLLSRVNPIFMLMTRLEGRVSLDVENLALPLGDAIKRGGAGRGRLDLRNMKCQPSGVWAELVQVGGMAVAQMYPVNVGKVDFTIKDGRIYYDNFALTYQDGFDLRFYGSVGFDDTVDLAVSLPVRPQLLARLGVRCPAADFVKLASDLRIDVPMSGTRLQPRLDFAKVDASRLLKGLTPKLSPGGPEGLIKGLLGDPSKSADKPPATRPPTANRPKQPDQPRPPPRKDSKKKGG